MRKNAGVWNRSSAPRFDALQFHRNLNPSEKCLFHFMPMGVFLLLFSCIQVIVLRILDVPDQLWIYISSLISRNQVYWTILKGNFKFCNVFYTQKICNFWVPNFRKPLNTHMWSMNAHSWTQKASLKTTAWPILGETLGFARFAGKMTLTTHASSLSLFSFHSPSWLLSAHSSREWAECSNLHSKKYY